MIKLIVKLLQKGLYNLIYFMKWILSFISVELIYAFCVFQVTCSPLPQLDTPSSVQKVQKSLKRTARMTPLWRIMGTKPHGAYCQNNYECSTGICR